MNRARDAHPWCRALGRLAAVAFLLCLPLLAQAVTETWNAASNLTTTRYGHTATLLPSGKVLVVGGFDGSGVLASAELYDPASNSWSAAGSLATARREHTATLLPSGKVLVAGGYNGSYLVSAELYDSGTNTWSAAGSLATAREYHTATLLPSGKVLVAGGESLSGSLTSALLYTLDLGFAISRRPILGNPSSPVQFGQSLQLSGTGFNGDSEASGGGTSTNSATNYPIVQLRRLDNDQMIWTSPASAAVRSDTAYTSAPLPTLPVGPYAVTLFVNAIPSNTRVIQVTSDAIFANGFNGP